MQFVDKIKKYVDIAVDVIDNKLIVMMLILYNKKNYGSKTMMLMFLLMMMTKMVNDDTDIKFRMAERTVGNDNVADDEKDDVISNCNYQLILQIWENNIRRKTTQVEKESKSFFIIS